MTSNAKKFRLNFEGGQTTGINSITLPADSTGQPADGAWYTLSGTRLSAKPAAPGIYVNGGRKVIIK